MIPDLETLFTDARFWGVTTATPVQRAFCRIAEGRSLGELEADPDVAWALGGPDAVAALAPGGSAPRHLSLYGAVRIGKSDLASCIAFRASQTIDLTGVRAHEVARIPILSLTRDLAEVTFGHLVGRLHKPELRPLLVDEGADFVTVRHPFGRIVEIMVVAGARAGGSLISRWIGGAVFDEKPRMLGVDEGVVNYPDALHAVEGRLLPGAQIVDLGSPWAPWGPAFDDVEQRWGKPTRHHVVLRVTGPMANPGWWTPARVADMRENQPRAYRTECMGDFCEPASSAIPSAWVDRAFRQLPRSTPTSGAIGIIDSSAGRGDAFVWAIGQWGITQPDEEYEGDFVTENGATFQVLTLNAYGQRIRKAEPAQPEPFLRLFGWGAMEGKFREAVGFDELVARIANHFKRHGVTRAVGDQYQSYPLAAEFLKHRIVYESKAWSQENKAEALGRIKNLFRDGQITIDAGPEAAKVRNELVQLQEKPTTAGGVTIAARRGGHDDRCAIVLDAGMLDSLGEFRGSPIELRRGMSVVPGSAVSGLRTA